MRGCIPDFGVGTVWRGIGASGGWNCYRLWARRSVGAGPGRTLASVSWGGCEGRHRAGTKGDPMRLAGRGLAGHFRLGTCHHYRHQVGEACCRRGGVAGAEPPHKGGPNRPDRPELQWSVVSCQLSVDGDGAYSGGNWNGIDRGFGASKGIREFTPILGCTRMRKSMLRGG